MLTHIISFNPHYNSPSYFPLSTPCFWFKKMRIREMAEIIKWQSRIHIQSCWLQSPCSFPLCMMSPEIWGCIYEGCWLNSNNGSLLRVFKMPVVQRLTSKPSQYGWKSKTNKHSCHCYQPHTLAHIRFTSFSTVLPEQNKKLHYILFPSVYLPFHLIPFLLPLICLLPKPEKDANKKILLFHQQDKSLKAKFNSGRK